MRSRYDDVALSVFFLHQHLCPPSSLASFLSHLPSQADISFLSLSESNKIYSSSRTGCNNGDKHYIFIFATQKIVHPCLPLPS